MSQITITIDKQGRPTVDAVGFTGGACKSATAPYLAALSPNAPPAEETLKPELYATEAEHNHLTN